MRRSYPVEVEGGIAKFLGDSSSLVLELMRCGLALQIKLVD